MLITFDKTSTRGAYGATSDSSRLDMREGASRNPAIQLRGVELDGVPSCPGWQAERRASPVAPSRVEENDGASFLTACCAALRDVAAIAAAILLICATGIGFTAAIYLLLFVSL
jgi:hypothetical protein